MLNYDARTKNGKNRLLTLYLAYYIKIRRTMLDYDVITERVKHTILIVLGIFHISFTCSDQCESPIIRNQWRKL